MDYQKPQVVQKGTNPEPVEAGCCLRSCGGSPGPMQVRKDTEVSKAIAAATAKL